MADSYPSAGDFWFSNNTNVENLKEVLKTSYELIERHFNATSHVANAIPTFYLSFLEPHINPNGYLLGQYTLENPTIFVREMNAYLDNLVRNSSGTYLLDLNEIASGIGRYRLQDDILYESAHGNILSDFDFALDTNRIVPVTPATEVFNVGTRSSEYVDKIIERVSYSMDIINKTNAIKMVVVDLDGTLWRGVAAEDDIDPSHRVEGWPYGFVEALLYFKKKGGLLAINSKNDLDETLCRFNEIWGYKINVDDFVSIKINWKSKVDNLSEIISETNILPQNIVVIDDNPRELDEISSGFPDIRNLGTNPYLWRKAILTLPEFQTETVTNESANRTRLIQSSVERSKSITLKNKAQWLQNLGLVVTATRLFDSSSQEFERVLELINKTNQFNTTGKRWLRHDLADIIAGGEYLIFFRARDNSVDNGIVGAYIAKDDLVVQMVLSCRVFGLGIELVMLHDAQNRLPNDQGKLLVAMKDTGRNSTCIAAFKELLYTEMSDGLWSRLEPIGVPSWIEVAP
nr:HAD-IIIC family phosphatase [Acidithiobacillus ferrooxidans]